MRKLLNWWKGLFHKTVYLDPRVTESPKYLHIVELNPDEASLVEALGIVDERGKEIHDFVVNEYHSSSHIVQVLEKASKQCRHANELAFACIVLQRIHDSHKMDFGGFLAQVLSQRGPQGGPVPPQG